MADERFLSEVPAAGGPRIFLSTVFHAVEALLLAILPDTDEATLDPPAAVFHVALDTVVATDAITVAGETLVFVSADAGDGEVLLGITDAASATALAAAINALAISGVTAKADDDTMIIQSAKDPDLAVTSADTTITVTALGGWIYLPDTVGDISRKFVEKHDVTQPGYLQQPTGSVITAKSIESVRADFKRRSLDAMKLILTQSSLTETAATSTSVGKRQLSFTAAAAPTVYRHLLGIGTNELGYWTLDIYPKVTPVGDFDDKRGGDATVLPFQFNVYAHEGCGTMISQVYTAVEMTGPKTS